MICLFSIASVSATELDDTVVTLDDDTQITLEEDANSIGELKDDLGASSQEDISTEGDEILAASSQRETLATSSDVEILGDADDGTFTALQKKIDDAADGATITLNKDYKYDEGFSERGIQIKKNLTINGNGHTLNGLSKSRILLVKFGLVENYKVVLNNIKFINGNTDLYGGAIFNYANLTVKNCIFTNNYAKYCGGAINSVGHLNLKNSKFTKNTAGGDAGAVFTFSIENPIEHFKKIYADKTPEGDMEFVFNDTLSISLSYGKDNVRNCTFTSNIAKGRGGGAIYGFTHLDINSSTFNSNQAGEHGGAIFANKNLNLKNSKFTGNKVSKYGGAVYFRCHEQSGSYVNKKWVPSIKYYSGAINNCTFSKNTAKKGGAIYGFLNVASDKKRLKINRCTFTDNKASSGRDVLGGTVTNSVYNYVKLTSSSSNVKKGSASLVLTAKLTKGKTVLKNKKVTFLFRGKTYTAKTNSKGIAKVIVKKTVLNTLKVGSKYAVKISYLTNSIKRTVKVKR